MSGSEPQRPKEIESQFMEAGWGRGASENILRTRVEEILKDIEETTKRRKKVLLRFLERHNFKPPADEDIDGLVRAALEVFAIPDAVEDIDRLVLQMAAAIRRMLDKTIAPMQLESGTSVSALQPGFAAGCWGEREPVGEDLNFRVLMADDETMTGGTPVKTDMGTVTGSGMGFGADMVEGGEGSGG